MNILIVSDNYPSIMHPTRGTFVYNLVQEMCRQGVSVTTVSPEKLCIRGGAVADSYGPELATVYRPRYVSFSNKTVSPGISTGWISVAAFTRAVARVVRGLKHPDIVYGHFLYPSGFAVSRVAEVLDVPAVVALGESSMERYERVFGVRAVRAELRRFEHVIAVSGVLRRYCVERMGMDASKITVIPNAVDTDLFQPPSDRQMVRRKLGLPADAFILTFLGHFNERKGINRVMAALEQHPEVRAIFIGDGTERPAGEQVLFAGPLKHHEVPEWLAAGDIFVLPTLAEGDPNAVKEALAIGLPVIVSDIPALREQFDNRFAMFVNPHDIEGLSRAIAQLKSDPILRADMAREAANFGRENSLSQRVEKILRLLDDVIAGS